MFSLTGIYAKLIASAVILALIGGAYFYVQHLNSTVTKLNRENATLSQSNDELKTTIQSEADIQTAIEKVSEAGNKQKVEYIKVRDNQLKNINENVRTGKDKPVGPLLKEFFNE